MGVTYYSIYKNSNGSVGIGTTGPSYNLHVVGNGYFSTTLKTSGNITNDGGTYFGGGANLDINQYNNGYLRFLTNNNEKMRIQADGTVGIGTSDPKTVLDVRYNNASTAASQVAGMTLRTNQNNGLEWHLNQTVNSYGGWVAAARVNSSSGSWGDGYLEFITAGLGGATTSTMTLKYGNVGINTLAPAEKLQVDGYILNRSKFGYTQRNDVVKNGLSFYVDFNNKTCYDSVVSGSSIKDLSNNNYALSLVNAAVISNKDGNTALYTSNNSSYLKIASYAISVPHTWEAWINGSSWNGWDTIWDSNTERPLIGLVNGSLQVYPNNTNCGNLTINKWYHIVVTADASSNVVTYVNGVATASFAYGNTFATGPRDYWLGGDGSIETFDGYIPIARTYNRVLSATEVMQNYNAEKWRFDSSSTLYHDVATGRVGIANTSPSSVFHVGAGSYNATNSSYSSAHFGSMTLMFRDGYDCYLGGNTVYTASGWYNKYGTYKACLLELVDGVFYFRTGTGTTAGADSSMATRATIANDGGFSNNAYIHSGTYLQTGTADNIYAHDWGRNLNLMVSNSANNAWVNGLILSPGGNVTIYNELVVGGNIDSDNCRTVYYSSVTTGPSGSWYPLFQIGDSTDATVLCNLKTYAHSSVTFVAAKGYGPSATQSISILNCQVNANGGYANVTGVRIRESGWVEIKLEWASGPSVNVTAQIIGTRYTPTFAGSLAPTAAVDSIYDTANLSNAMIRSRGNMEAANGYIAANTTSPARPLTVNGDGTNPCIRLLNSTFATSTNTALYTFRGWLPIDIGTTKYYLQVFN